MFCSNLRFRIPNSEFLLVLSPQAVALSLAAPPGVQPAADRIAVSGAFVSLSSSDRMPPHCHFDRSKADAISSPNYLVAMFCFAPELDAWKV